MPNIKTVGPGREYENLQTWWDAIKTESDAAQWAECYGGGNLGTLDATGHTFTTTSTDYVNIYAAPGHRHNLVWDTNKAHIDVGDVGNTDTSGIRFHVNFGRIDGLQIKGEGFVRLLNDYDNSAVNGVGGPYYYSDLLIIGGAGSTSNRCFTDTYIRGDTSRHGYWRNCTFVNLGYGAMFTQNGSCLYYIDNCGFIECGGYTDFPATRWALTNFVTHEMKNCYILNTNGMNTIEAVFSIGTVHFTNCYITDESISNLVWGQTDCTENGAASGQLINVSSDWKTLPDSDFVGAGLDLSSDFTTDAVGNIRVAPWWIGPYQSSSYDPGLIKFATERIQFSSNKIVFTA